MLEIWLPWPDKALAPNRRLGKAWQSTHKAKVAARASGASAAINAAIRGNVPLWLGRQLTLELTFCPPDKRRRDLDNLLSSCKGSLDGIAAALGIDDSQFSPVILQWGEVVKSGNVKVVIR